MIISTPLPYTDTRIYIQLELESPKFNFKKNRPQISFRSVFLAGCVAGSGSSFINTPTELVKCLAQTNLKNKGTVMEEWPLVRHGPTGRWRRRKRWWIGVGARS